MPVRGRSVAFQLFQASSIQFPSQLYRGQAPGGRSAVWDFDEGKVSIARDGSGNGNDAAIAGEPSTPFV
jgi:hypothetical protein